MSIDVEPISWPGKGTQGKRDYGRFTAGFGGTFAGSGEFEVHEDWLLAVVLNGLGSVALAARIGRVAWRHGDGGWCGAGRNRKRS